ncbi:Hypothetical predicted protein [Cloeon dipterum]|uniref:tRNA-dihydrouridine(16/17) synthase [NAD(P)(+)] n=1 Tax=Cloeon dipterum TaxID=197152 RepID=A0A8S1BRS7_9INSE|nr:Hypothetical predicted protein [Cloeon dipterum]
MEFWRDKLKGAKFVLAPMVEGSELAWRMLARQHGADLCYTPMWHGQVFCKDPKYRAEALASCPDDRPLIVQFCSNDPDIFTEAAALAQDHCEAVDLNLGCPQAIAKRGNYGAFLQDEWQLLHDMVRKASSTVKVPITCKIRVFEDIRRTVDYARMLEGAGASLLTVHGRTREQKGPLTGLANWSYIKEVRQSVSVPMFANGNIQSLADVLRCIEETGVQGIMSAEGHLHNPAIFEGVNPPVYEMAEEYLTLVKEYPCATSIVRGHIFKLMHHVLALPENFDVRYEIAKAQELSNFESSVKKIRERYEKHATGIEKYSQPNDLPFDVWLCQPYVRMPPDEYLKKLKEANEANKNGEGIKRSNDEDGPPELSKKKQKVLERNPRKKFERKKLPLCSKCLNPKGLKCGFFLCKSCCRSKCYQEELDCPGHRILVKTRRNMAREHANDKTDASPYQEV